MKRIYEKLIEAVKHQYDKFLQNVWIKMKSIVKIQNFTDWPVKISFQTIQFVSAFFNSVYKSLPNESRLIRVSN